tara:strand:+ start:1763 stop:2674 length:912 start_codon:yes stop_codon:yes gene_type:complete
MRVDFYLVIVFLSLIGLLDEKPVTAQEFNCAVNINDEQLEGTSYDYVKQTLATELTSYINEFRWTEIEVLEHERINCQISIILTSANTDYTFSAEAVISSRRPIYGSMQETTSIILSDQAWQFSYPEGRSLVHDELSFEALTGFIDYYAYLILGYDFDSFAELGGSDYFAKAQDVVDLSQSSNAIGWARSSNNRRNRFTLVADMMNSSYYDLRRAYYTYHRKALDGFTKNPDQARDAVLEALELIQSTKRRSTSNFLFDLFFDTKSREIAAMLVDAESQIRLAAYNILSETDQAHMSDYENLQ